MVLCTPIEPVCSAIACSAFVAMVCNTSTACEGFCEILWHSARGYNVLFSFRFQLIPHEARGNHMEKNSVNRTRQQNASMICVRFGGFVVNDVLIFFVCSLSLCLFAGIRSSDRPIYTKTSHENHVSNSDFYPSFLDSHALPMRWSDSRGARTPRCLPLARPPEDWNASKHGWGKTRYSPR